MAAVAPLSPAPELAHCTFTIPEDDQDLRDGITRLAGHINAAEYRFLKLLAALIELRPGWGRVDSRPRLTGKH